MRTLLIFFAFSWPLLNLAQNNTLNAGDIASIEIKKVNPKSAKLQRELRLNEKQIIEFTSVWNNSVKDSSTKIKPEYFLFVTLKNKETKYFASGADQIDNGAGDCRSKKGIQEYLDNLWKSLCE